MRVSIGLVVTCWLGIAPGATAQAPQHEPPPGTTPAHLPREMNRRFTAPEVDVDGFVDRFENDGREVFRRRVEIVRALGLPAGAQVADIGAGTGLFTHLFAAQVGEQGRVYAVDIAPAFLEHIRRRAESDGHGRIVQTVRSGPDRCELPPGSIDVAFLCDTYHHFEHPRRMLDSIRQALRPGGRLVLVDFDLRPDSSDFVKQRARAPRTVYVAEIQEAGFEPVELADAPTLADQFFLAFRRVETGP